MTNEQESNQKLIISEIESVFKRIIDSKRLSKNDIVVLCQYGVITGLIYINDILKTIDEKGEKAAGKKITGDKIELLVNSMRSEFYFRTNLFYAQGHGLLIPEELGLAFITLIDVVYELEFDMLYGKNDLNKSMNQKELSYLFAALAKMNYFRSNPTLLADSLCTITDYSEDAVIRVIQNFNSTNGGLSDIEKQNLLKKIKDAIDSY